MIAVRVFAHNINIKHQTRRKSENLKSQYKNRRKCLILALYIAEARRWCLFFLDLEWLKKPMVH